jgi:hypothetical protein
MAGFCRPPMPIWPTPEICEIFGIRMFSAKASTVVSGSVSEVRASHQDRRVGWVHFADGRRVGNAHRQIGASGVDRCEHILCRAVDVTPKIELDRKLGDAERAR